MAIFAQIFYFLRARLKRGSRSEIFPIILLTILLILIGTVGFALLEGWSWLVSLYATIITITTVGYGDFSPQTIPGRIFAIFFTLTAIGLAGYAISTLAANLIENAQVLAKRKALKRRMNQIADLENHMIVCGANTLAVRVASEFLRQNVPFVVIEQDEELLHYALLWMNDAYLQKRLSHYDSLAEVDYSEEEQMSIAELAEVNGVLYLLEDPTDEQVLRRAGIHKARGLVAALEDDRDNTSIILSGRDMGNRLGNASLRIVGGASDAHSMHRLYLAGANKVISPHMSGGFQVATEMLHPVVGDFWQQMLFQTDHKIRFLDVDMAKKPAWVGKLVGELNQGHEQLVVAIRRNGTFIYAPDSAERLMAEDVLIMMGDALVVGQR
jgi:voltage-gated potassium channel